MRFIANPITPDVGLPGGMVRLNLIRKTILYLLGSPSKKIAQTVGIDDGRVDDMQLDLVNRINEDKFKSVPKRDRIFVLPHCMRSRNCPARIWKYGYTCMRCGRCRICALDEAAAKEGYRAVFVVPGASVVHRIIKKYRPKAVLAVACMKELVPAIGDAEKLGITGQAVPLLRDGCIDTIVDCEAVTEKLRL